MKQGAWARPEAKRRRSSGPAAAATEAEQDQHDEQGVGRPLSTAPVVMPAVPGVTGVPPTWTGSPASPAFAASSDLSSAALGGAGAGSGVLESAARSAAAAGRAAAGARRGPAAATGAVVAAALAPAGARRREHVAAVGVLVDVGGQALARLADLARRVVVGSLPFLAVADHVADVRASAGGATSSVSATTASISRRIGEATLAAPRRRLAPTAASARDIPAAQASWCTGARPPARRRPAGRAAAASSCSRRSAAASAPASPAGTTSPVRLVADEPAGGGADGIGGDHGDSLVEGFVDDEPPRLAEVARGDGRYDHNVGPRIEVAQLDRWRARRPAPRRWRRPGLGSGRRRPEPARRSVLTDPRRARPEEAPRRLFPAPVGPTNATWNGRQLAC